MIHINSRLLIFVSSIFLAAKAVREASREALQVGYHGVTRTLGAELPGASLYADDIEAWHDQSSGSQAIGTSSLMEDVCSFFDEMHLNQAFYHEDEDDDIGSNWIPDHYYVYDPNLDRFFTRHLDYRTRLLVSPRMHSPRKYLERKQARAESLAEDSVEASNDLLSEQIEDHCKMYAMKTISDPVHLQGAIFDGENQLVYFNSGIPRELVRNAYHDNTLPSLYFDRHERIWRFDFDYVAE